MGSGRALLVLVIETSNAEGVRPLFVDFWSVKRLRRVKILADPAARLGPALRRASGLSRALLAPSLRSGRWSETNDLLMFEASA